MKTGCGTKVLLGGGIFLLQLPLILLAASPAGASPVATPPVAPPTPPPASAIAAVPPATPDNRPVNLWDNVAVPVLQVAGAEGVMLLSVAAIDAASRPWADALLLAMPVGVGMSTCGIGVASQRYRGSCWHSMLGVGLGLVSGLVVFSIFEAAPGLNPVTPNQDDTQEFANTMGALVFTALIGIPGGSVIAWHVGKVPAQEPAAGQSSSSMPPVVFEPAFVSAPARALSLRGDAPIRFVVPLISGRF